MLLLLLACAPESTDSNPPVDTDADTDVGTDSGLSADDTAGDTANGNVAYRGTTTGSVDSELHYDCVGFSAFTVALDGTIVGNAEGHCSLPEDPEVFQHLEGPIAGSSTAGTLAGTWSITLCDTAVVLDMIGTVSASEVVANLSTSVPCTVALTMSATAR